MSDSNPAKPREPFPWFVLREPMGRLLIAVNLVPVLGILSWGWDLFSMMFLYWSEAVILWVFQSMRTLLSLGRAAAGNLVLTTLFFGFMAMFPFGFICALFGAAHGGHSHDLPAFLAESFMRERLWVGQALFLAVHGFNFLIFLVKKLRTQSALRKDEDHLGIHRPLDDLREVADPTVQEIMDLKKQYGNLAPPRPLSHPSQALRDRNLGKTMGFILFEPSRRMVLLLISIWIGAVLGYLIPIFLSVLVGKVMVDSFHVDGWILAFLAYFKTYFDLYYYGRHASIRREREQSGAEAVHWGEAVNPGPRAETRKAGRGPA